MTRFEEYCVRQGARWGDKFDASGLAPQFVHAYNNGERFRVKVGCADKPIWGFVGCTTGWRPSFMLMRTRTQRGSSSLLRADDVILCTKWLRK